eukprot:RCo036812
MAVPMVNAEVAGNPGFSARRPPDEPGEAPEVPEEVLLCCFWQLGRLGFAVFCSATGLIQAGETMDTDHFLNLDSIKLQFQPTSVITASQTEQAFVEALARVEGLSPLPTAFLRRADFTFERARARLTAHFGEPRGSAVPGLLSDVSAFDFDSVFAVRAAGALLSHLLKTPSASFAQIRGIVQCAMCGVMNVDVSTLNALQIFKIQRHPAADQGIGHSKEGHSLYGLLNRTRSTIGAQLLRQWMFRPCRNQAALTSRLDTVEYFMHPENQEQLPHFQNDLKCICDVSRLLARMRTARASILDWTHLMETIHHFMQIVQRAESLPGFHRLPILAKIVSGRHVADFADLETRICQGVDFQASKQERHLVIKPGFNEMLDKYRDVYTSLDGFLSSTALAVGRDLPLGHLSGLTLTVVYFLRVGYLISVPVDCYEGEGHPEVPGLEFQFQTEDNFYYKDDRMRELDAKLGDVKSIISECEDAAAEALRERVLSSQDSLRAVQYCAELDCLLSFASCALERSFVRPQLNSEAVLDVREGRHPLQELCVSGFVPNDVHLSSEVGKMAVLTGPNCSGKSVFLKQIGLIVFMAHLGCFVPASSATVPLVDRIFTRVHSELGSQGGGTGASGCSAFGREVWQMNVLLRYCTGNSLVLVDEFGKGTLASDGVALLAASLRYLLRRRQECPLSVISTHLTEILERKLLDSEGIFQPLTMKVLAGTPSAAEGAEEPRFSSPVYHTAPSVLSRFISYTTQHAPVCGATLCRCW